MNIPEWLQVGLFVLIMLAIWFHEVIRDLFDKKPPYEIPPQDIESMQGRVAEARERWKIRKANSD